MKVKTTTLLIISILSCISILVAAAKPEKRTRHAKSSKPTRKSSKKTKLTRNIKQNNNLSTQNKKEEKPIKNDTNTTDKQENKITKNIKEQISKRKCDSNYMRCMNKFCSNDKLGKCLCYEDNYTNTKENMSFVNIDGIQIKKGFELLNYSKKECAEILDSCEEDKRGIWVKYKNFIQRDCLLLSDKIIEKGEGLATELKELEECMKPGCTVMSNNIPGAENYAYPPFSLCFNENTAKFFIGTMCSKIIKKAKSPETLKQLFYDKIALLRERSCISMDGNFSNDRKNCNIYISYGQSKDTITSTKLFPVGSIFECSADNFGVKLEESMETKQARVNNILEVSAQVFNIAGAALSFGGKADPIGTLVDKGIDGAEMLTELGFKIQDYKDGKISTKNLSLSTINTVASIGLSFAGGSKAGKIIKAAGGIAVGAVNTGDAIYECANAKTDAEKANHCANIGIASAGMVTSAVGLKGAINSDNSSSNNSDKKIGAINSIGGLVKSSINVVKGVTDIAMTEEINKEKRKEEELALNKHTSIDRSSGKGIVNTNTVTNHGNCYLNGEWFATENEQVYLLWRD